MNTYLLIFSLEEGNPRVFKYETFASLERLRFKQNFILKEYDLPIIKTFIIPNNIEKNSFIDLIITFYVFANQHQFESKPLIIKDPEQLIKNNYEFWYSLENKKIFIIKEKNIHDYHKLPKDSKFIKNFIGCFEDALLEREKLNSNISFF